jgi:hypothetical protein
MLMLQSCGPHKRGIWMDEQIESGVRKDKHALNATMLTNLKVNEFKALQFIMSKEMVDDPEMIRKIEHLSNDMKTDSFSLLHEYYIVSKPGTDINLKGKDQSGNNYDIHFVSDAREMYLAFFVPKGRFNQMMISAIYSKFDYGWKLNSLDIAPYIINGKTAAELYNLAVADYNKGYLIDTYNLMTEASQCAAPCEGWEYGKSMDMNALHSKVLKECNAKYKFPYTIAKVTTHPEIFWIGVQKNTEGQFPLIYYKSSINLKDTVAVKKENDQIRKEIGNVMPGINMDKKYVFYSAFNKRPAPSQTVDHFDITDKL